MGHITTYIVVTSARQQTCDLKSALNVKHSFSCDKRLKTTFNLIKLISFPFCIVESVSADYLKHRSYQASVSTGGISEFSELPLELLYSIGPLSFQYDVDQKS